MSQKTPRVSSKQFGGIMRVEWIDQGELNKFLVVLEGRVTALETENAALKDRVAALEAAATP